MVWCSGCSGWCARVLGGGEDAPAPEVFAASAPDNSLTAKLAVPVPPAAGSEELLAQLSAVFDAIDKNHDGAVSRSELLLALRRDPALAERLRLPQHVRQEGGTRAAFERVFAEIDADGSATLSLRDFARYFERGAGGAAPVLTLVDAETSDVLWEADVSGAIRADGAGVRGISFCTSSYALRIALLDGGIVEFNLETKASTQVVFETQAPDGSLLARLECPQLKGAHRMLSLIEEDTGATLWQNDVQHALAGRQVDSIAFDRTRFVLDIHDAAGGRIEFNLETKEAVPVAATSRRLC